MWGQNSPLKVCLIHIFLVKGNYCSTPFSLHALFVLYVFHMHRNVVLSPKGSGKPAKSFDVTYIPLGDLASQKFQRSSISQIFLVKMLWALTFS